MLVGGLNAEEDSYLYTAGADFVAWDPVSR